MLCRCCFCGFLFSASAFEDMGQAIVPLVTGVLEDRTLEPLQQDFAGPRLGPSTAIFHRETINDGLCIHASQALDDVHFFARKNILPGVCGWPTEGRLVRE